MALSSSSPPPGTSITVHKRIRCFCGSAMVFATTWYYNTNLFFLSSHVFRQHACSRRSVCFLSCVLRLTERRGGHKTPMTDWLGSPHCVIAIERAAAASGNEAVPVAGSRRCYWQCWYCRLTSFSIGTAPPLSCSSSIPTSTQAPSFAASLRLCNAHNACA